MNKKSLEEMKDIIINGLDKSQTIDALEKVELMLNLSKMLENEFLVKSYSYTHNKELPVKTLDKSHIVINFSYNVDNKHKNIIYNQKKKSNHDIYFYMLLHILFYHIRNK